MGDIFFSLLTFEDSDGKLKNLLCGFDGSKILATKGAGVLVSVQLLAVRPKRFDTMASAEPIPESMIDMITYEILEDPVVAEDGHVYSRNSLLDWFDGCTEVGEAITSPLTGRPMSTSMKPEPNLARQVEQFKARGGKSQRFNESTQTIGTLAKIFEIIDPLRDLFATKNWQAPALVVMGNENSGKSTLLERLAMMPIFPKDKFICTRMAIRVHLRRGPCMAPRLDVFDKQTGTVSPLFFSNKY